MFNYTLKKTKILFCFYTGMVVAIPVNFVRKSAFGAIQRVGFNVFLIYPNI